MSPPLLGPFRLGPLLGAGGMGSVYAAEHVREGIRCAVKVITASVASDEAFRTAFRAEVRATAQLDHPGILTVLDYGILPGDVPRPLCPGCPFMVMERAGGSLLSAPPADWPALHGVLMDVLAALAHAHARGVIHRDLKPANLLWSDQGVKLADFGIAWSAREAEMLPSTTIGTEHYMAPEQVLGRFQDFGPWTDLYALASTAWEFATGSPPFGSLEGAKLRSAQLLRRPGRFEPRFEVPAHVEAWLRGMLAKRTGDRPHFAIDAARSLEGSALAQRARETPRPLLGSGLGVYALRTVPLVDRDAERARLWAALEDVHTSRTPRILGLRGASGDGKTRLARWLSELAHTRGMARSLVATHAPSPSAQDGLGPALQEAIGVRGLRPTTARRRIRGLLDADDVEDTLRTLEPGGDAPAQTRQLGLQAVLRQCAGERAVILVIDDAQWALQTLPLMPQLLASAVPVLVVLTVRDEALRSREAERSWIERLLDEDTTLHLAPLAPSDHERLVVDLLRLEPKLAARVMAITHGNALFAIQLVGHWVAQGLLRTGRDGFHLISETTLPTQIGAVWEARLMDFAADRIPLELAALLGSQVSGEEWGELCAAQGEPAGPDLLDRLLDRHLIVGNSAQWRFVHGALRETLLAGLHGARRASFHDAARVVVRGQPAREGHHALGAGRPLAALEPLERAIRLSLQRRDIHVALAQLGDYERALADAQIDPSDERFGNQLVFEARIQRGLGNMPLSEALCEDAVVRGTTHGWSRALAMAKQYLARFIGDRGQPERAVLLLREAEAHHRSAGDPVAAEGCVMDLADHIKHRGRVEESRSIYRAFLERVPESSAPLMHAAAHMAMGGLSIRDGDYADAERRLSQAEILFRQHGGRYHLMAIRNERGELARYRGDLAAAARYYEEAWVGMRAANPQTASVYRMNLAMVAVLQRDWIRARANLDAALAALETHGMRPVIGAALVMRLCVDAAEHDWTLWDTHIERARTLLHEASFFDEDTARMAALAASLAHSAGEPTRAASAMGIATTQLRGLEQG